jgi:hypothetical protein
MLTLPPGARVFVATARVDGRKGIDGLSVLVRSQFAEDPLSGTMYVFFSRRGDRVRVLYWDRDGYVLVMKRHTRTRPRPRHRERRPPRSTMLCRRDDRRYTCAMARERRGFSWPTRRSSFENAFL